MTRARKVPDERLIELVRAGRGTWRHSALGAAISYTFGCHPRYARTVIAKAVERGIVVKDDVFYRLPEPARPSTTPRQSKPAGFAHPPISERPRSRGSCCCQGGAGATGVLEVSIEKAYSMGAIEDTDPLDEDREPAFLALKAKLAGPTLTHRHMA